jgi:egghead protein (zeste-white 4 protein)
MRTLAFRAQALSLLAAMFVGLLYLHFAVLPRAIGGSGFFVDVYTWSSLLWVTPFVFTGATVLGLLVYRTPSGDDAKLEPIGTPVVFRIVSRGFDRATVWRTVESVRSSMSAHPLFPYWIEVVTDSADMALPWSDELRHIGVPREYRTPNGSLYKARALHYALQSSSLPDHGWIVHLDEETCVTPSFVVGIRRAVEEEERSGRHRTGAGIILYHHSLDSHPFMTLAESTRSGEDSGRYHLLQRLGFPVFGLHGSGLVIRNSVEKAIGLDFGPGGSITEDAYLALFQMERGYRARWVDGYVVEQAAFTLSDYLRQRRRWFVGITKTAMHAPVAFRYRAPMLVAMLAWALSWTSVSYTYSSFIAGSRAPTLVVILSDFVLATYIALGLIGLKLNLDGYGRIALHRRAALYLAQFVCIPLFSIMEGAAVFYGLVHPDQKFHVVKKDVNAPARLSPAPVRASTVTSIDEQRIWSEHVRWLLLPTARIWAEHERWLQQITTEARGTAA